MHNTFTLTSKTYIDLEQPDIYQRFIREYLELLRSKLQRSKVMDQNGDLRKIRYSCGQAHDPRNPNWKPFKYLEQICRKRGYDDMEAREVIEEQD
ncbi:hypothetical protein DSCW_20280 [Desulfosarcina widdelii]|uniref:Uncharacterized protein n=1 Tax=Desulfosarcina widdelii TaxID=947919 RepID=A0A5K7Z4S7_9BACT|nr:hypothetical protein [Desulfosarcina widdelii]BBO74611.1 hypothetical protein DSCW_20280 [Desulfosarcina widdelii]